MIRQAKNSDKVFVGLSGGVDSAVSAALLKRAGYDVTGIFIEVWQPDWMEPALSLSNGCNWKEERREAMRVAAHLGIPFISLDLKKEYKQSVIDYMIAEYRAGRTPNPDVMCNREVKFGAFWDWAKSNGADYIATGHYARILYPLGATGFPPSAPFGSVRRKPPAPSDAIYRLLAGVDANKNQSYFLWTLRQDDLAHTLFPVGGILKSEVRELAAKFKLPNAEKKDSQGLCFIGKIDFNEFLAHFIKPEPGNVLDESGEIIGRHDGALFFTMGERHGFTITKKTPGDPPYYVVDKDTDQNTVTVSTKEQKQYHSEEMIRIEQVNWASGEAPTTSGDYKVNGLKARSRYRQELQNIQIESVGIAETVIKFEKRQEALTPGQSLVIYRGEECLGGGVIT